MRKFNLTFKGGILPGYKPEQARARLADFFGIDDPSRVEPFFSGKPVVLRRDLNRKEAGDLFRKLRDLGLETELVTVSEDPEDLSPTPKASAGTKEATAAPHAREQEEKPAEKSHSTRGMVREIRRQQPGQIDQSWAVPSRPAKSKPPETSSRRASLEGLKAAAQARLKTTSDAEDNKTTQPAAADAPETDEATAAQRRHDAAEEAALRKAEDEDRKRIAAEEAARRKAEEDERKRIAVEEAARRKAEEDERKRIAAEEAARRKAEEDERRRIAAEEAARRKAEEDERKRIAAEEAARRKAENKERKRVAAEEAARRKAEEAERKRIAAEEAAKRRAEEKRKQEASAARRKAEEAEAKRQRKAAKEAARSAAMEAARKRRAEQAEAKRQAREEAAKAKALRDAKKQAERERVAEERARKQAARKQAAAEAAERKALEKERKLLAAAEAARQQAEEEHRRAEEAAVQLAEREAARVEQARLRDESEARAKQAREEAAQARKAAEDKARAQALADKRKAKARADQERAARQHALAQEKAAQQAAERAAEESRRELEEKSVEVAAKKLGTEAGIAKPVPKVRSKLELPRRGATGGKAGAPGAPNLFALQAFRATADVRQRSALAFERWRLGASCLAASIIALLLLGNHFRLLPESTIPGGPEAIASDPAGNLYIWSGSTLYLHDRAGVDLRQVTAEDLGIPNAVTEMAWAPSAGLLVTTKDERRDPNSPWASHLCEPPFDRCQADSHGVAARAIDYHPRTGARIQLDITTSQLSRTDANGIRVATATIAAPVSPVLRLQDGLLFMNSAHGPAISVFRPDAEGFGRQLDEILLLPPGAIHSGLDQVRDFVRMNDQWWVLLANPSSDAAGIYRFDDQWNLLGELALPDAFTPAAVINWAGRGLVFDARTAELPRYSKAGVREAPLKPAALLADIEAMQSSASLRERLWRLGLAMLSMFCLAVAVYSYLQLLRSRVYRGSQPRGAVPIDSMADQIEWVTPSSQRFQHYGRLAIMLGLAFLGLLLTAIGLQASVTQLGAVLLVAGAVLLVLYWVYRMPLGYLGTSAQGMVIVDHSGLYHLGSGPRIRYRGNVVLIDDVMLFMGNPVIPVFDPEQLTSARAVMATGIRVERQVIWVHLLQARHPLALGCITLMAALALGLALAVT